MQSRGVKETSFTKENYDSSHKITAIEYFYIINHNNISILQRITIALQ